ncbi:MAG TPA: hypothetical protein VL201_00565 [Patescibacteria group bacterium]|jgi:hypothetical protein|nr:hypothetical protein [Patescibacteria group bacterium]
MDHLNKLLLFLLENKRQLLQLIFVVRVIALGEDGPPGEAD